MSKKHDIEDLNFVVENLIKRVGSLSTGIFNLERRLGTVNERVTCVNNNCDTLFTKNLVLLDEERRKQEIINNKGKVFSFRKLEGDWLLNDFKVNLEKNTSKTKTVSFDLFLVKYTVELVEVNSKIGDLYKVKEVSYKGEEK